VYVIERRAGLVVCAVTQLPSTPGKQWVRKKYTSPTNRYVFQRCGAYPAAISRKYVYNNMLRRVRGHTGCMMGTRSDNSTLKSHEHFSMYQILQIYLLYCAHLRISFCLLRTYIRRTGLECVIST